MLKQTCRFSALSIVGMIIRWENRSTPRKTYSIASSSTTNHKFPDLKLMPGLHGKKPAINSLNHWTALAQKP